MSKYTTEIRFICENYSGLSESVGYSSIDSVIEKAVPKIFDFSFPIFDENYRFVLCSKILKHYYTREISEETVGLWKLRLNTRMNEIMPYYNQMYKSETMQFDPLKDTDYTRTGNRGHDGKETTINKQERIIDNDGSLTDKTEITTNVDTNDSGSSNTTNQSTTTTERVDMYTDTPQGALTNVLTGEYLTNARKTTDNQTTNSTQNSSATAASESNTESNSTRTATNKNLETVNDDFNGDKTIKTTDDYIENITGKSSGISYSKLLLEYRKTFLNIDMLIINALADLFFNLW